MTTHEKFRAARHVCMRLAEVVSEACGTDYGDKLNQLRSLLQSWESQCSDGDSNDQLASGSMRKRGRPKGYEKTGRITEEEAPGGMCGIHISSAKQEGGKDVVMVCYCCPCWQ